jgi:hypothetical protein
VLPEEPLEARPRLDQQGAGERLTGEQQASAAVRDGEGQAVLAIAQFVLALVVGGPHRLRRLHRRGGRARGAGATHAPARGDQPQMLKAPRDGRSHRPGPPASAAPRGGAACGAPVRVAVMSLEQSLEQHGIEGGGRAVGTARLIRQAGRAQGAIAGEELVAGLAADPVGRTQPGDRNDPAQSVMDELLAERCRLTRACSRRTVGSRAPLGRFVPLGRSEQGFVWAPA